MCLHRIWASGYWTTGSTVVKSIVFVRSTRFLLHPPAISSDSTSCSVETPGWSQHFAAITTPIRTPASRFPSLYRQSRNVPFDCFECLRIHAVLPTSRFQLFRVRTISIKVETNSSLHRENGSFSLVLGVFIPFYEKLRIQLAAAS